MENMTRQELQDFIKSKEDELAELRILSANGEDIPLGKIHELEDEIEEAESELEKIAELEGDYDSGTNLSNAIEEHEEDLDDVEPSQPDDGEELLNHIQQKEQEKELDEEIDETKEAQELDENLEQEISIDDGKARYTLTAWQIKTGIEIVPDDYIRRKYDKYLTEEDFKDILANENVPKIIQEPGSAEKYLKSAEDWDSVRTSKSALEQAILSGNFPVDVNDESYILLQYDKDTIRDYDNDKDDPSYAVIDKKDIYGTIDEEQSYEEEEKEVEEATEKEDNAIVGELAKSYINGKLAVKAKDALELAKKVVVAAVLEAQGPMVASVVGKGIDVVEKVGKAAFEKIHGTMGHDVEHPEIEEPGEEIETDDFGEIPSPTGGVS